MKTSFRSTYADRLEDPESIGILRNERRPLIPNARLARAMLRLALHGLDAGYREEAGHILAALSGDLSEFGVHGVEAALGIEEAVTEPLVVRISGPPTDTATRELRRAAVNSPRTWTLVSTAKDSDSATPGAELVWGGESRQVSDPSRMREAIVELTGEAP